MSEISKSDKIVVTDDQLNQSLEQDSLKNRMVKYIAEIFFQPRSKKKK